MFCFTIAQVPRLAGEPDYQNKCNFAANMRFVAIHALFERLSSNVKRSLLYRVDRKTVSFCPTLVVHCLKESTLGEHILPSKSSRVFCASSKPANPCQLQQGTVGGGCYKCHLWLESFQFSGKPILFDKELELRVKFPEGNVLFFADPKPGYHIRLF